MTDERATAEWHCARINRLKSWDNWNKIGFKSDLMNWKGVDPQASNDFVTYCKSEQKINELGFSLVHGKYNDEIKAFHPYFVRVNQYHGDKTNDRK